MAYEEDVLRGSAPIHILPSISLVFIKLPNVMLSSKDVEVHVGQIFKTEEDLYHDLSIGVTSMWDKEIVGLHGLLVELGFSQSNSTLLYTDNTSAI